MIAKLLLPIRNYTPARKHLDSNRNLTVTVKFTFKNNDKKH